MRGLEPHHTLGRLVAAVAAAAILLVGCSSDESGGSDDMPATTTAATTTLPDVAPLVVDFAEAPFPVGATEGVQFATDISCGDQERNVFDIALPPGAEPGTTDTPWVVYLHGGGFTAGDKSGYWEDLAEAGDDNDAAAYLDAGVAVVSMNYRLLDAVDSEGVIKPMGDVARCLQFLRLYGPSTFGLDPENVVLTGGSAGAGTALWLGTHDDLADPASADPVARQSTRPVAVAVRETQATYDLTRWIGEVFADYSDTFGDSGLVDIAIALGQGQRLLSFFGVTAPEALQTPELVEYRDNVDILAQMDGDDVPIWVANTQTDEAVPVNLDLIFHHPHHARILGQRAEEVGLPAVVTFGPGAIPSESQRDFVLRSLGV